MRRMNDHGSEAERRHSIRRGSAGRLAASLLIFISDLIPRTTTARPPSGTTRFIKAFNTTDIENCVGNR
jgi:hypothetical protein